MSTPKAFLQITLNINTANRSGAASVYMKYKQPFLANITGALSKELLIRNEDVQVLHGFNTLENAQAYLKSELFTQDVVKELSPFLTAEPDVRIYTVA